MQTNIDTKTVEDFGNEWSHFDQSTLSAQELQENFDRYFHIFPWQQLPKAARGFDLGCGSGRWAKLVAARVAHLTCIDASSAALEVAKRNLANQSNCEFIHASVDSIPLPDNSMDFCYSLGVLHHVPDTAAGIKACAQKLKPGAPFLLYLYYAFDNRPLWFRMIWQASDLLRRIISKLPFALKNLVAQLIALFVYLPLARLALVLEKTGRNVDVLPLSVYRTCSFYTMRTDALDRFGTRLEQRFTAAQIRAMMSEAGLEDISFSAAAPYWVAVGYKTASHEKA